MTGGDTRDGTFRTVSLERLCDTMRWSTQSLLACGAVIPLALAVIISRFVIIAFAPGLLMTIRASAR